MGRFSQGALTVVALLLGAVCGGRTTNPAADPLLVVRGATLLTGGPGPPVAGAEIHIRSGVIESAGPPTGRRLPSGARVLEAEGRIALPGLIDLHQHAVVTAEQPWHWLAQGVTAVRDPGGDLERGRRLRSRIDSGELAGPRLFLGLTIDLEAGQTPEKVRRRIAEEAVLGLDLVKLYLRTPVADARAAIAEAHARGLPVTWHLGPPLSEALELGADGVEHLYLFRELMPPPAGPPAATTAGAFLQIYTRWARYLDPATAPAQALLRRLAASGVVWTPTLTLAERIALGRSAYSEGWSDVDRAAGAAGFQSACRMVGEAWRQGVRIGAGTDTEDPADLHHELELLVGCGLPPAAALQSATAHAALALRQQGVLGAIAPGAMADLILVDGNPLDDIRDTRRIWRVLWGGEIVDPAALSPATRRPAAAGRR